MKHGLILLKYSGSLSGGMETKSNGMMPAKAVKDAEWGEYRYEYEDGYKISIDRSLDYPDQIRVSVRNSHRTVSTMLVWARKDAPV